MLRKVSLIVVLFTISRVLFGGDVLLLKGIKAPVKIDVDKYRLYAAEKNRVYIYSLSESRFIKEFGTVGEGPGEFKQGIRKITSRETNLLIESSGRLSYFSKDGEFVKQKEIAGVNAAFYFPVGRYFVGRAQVTDTGKSYNTLNLFDSDFQKVKEVRRVLNQTRKRKIMMFTAPFSYGTSGERIFIACETGFIIHAFDVTGKALFTIKKDYKNLNVSAEHKESIYHYFKTSPRTAPDFEMYKEMLEFPAQLPAVRFIFVGPRRLYVQTYKMRNAETEVYIFDLDGKFIKTVFVPLKGRGADTSKWPGLHTFAYDKFYEIVKNDQTEEWELHITEI